MKKLTSIIILTLFWCNVALSQTQTYNCKKLYGYIEDDWKYVATFSDETATLIMENNVSEKNHIEDLTIELRKELKWIRQLLVVIVFILIVDSII